MTSSGSTGLERLSSLPLTPNLRAHQAHAIAAIEDALAHGRQLMQLDMATGSGKTFTVLNAVARLMTAGVATRVLYLVDRESLVSQTRYVAERVETSVGQRFVDHFAVYSEADALKQLSSRFEDSGAHAVGVREAGGYLCIAAVKAVGDIFRITDGDPALGYAEPDYLFPEDLCDLLIADNLRDTAVRTAIVRTCSPIAISLRPEDPSGTRRLSRTDTPSNRRSMTALWWTRSRSGPGRTSARCPRGSTPTAACSWSEDRTTSTLSPESPPNCVQLDS